MSDRIVSKTMSGRRILSVLPHRSVWEAASIMNQTNHSSVLVLDHDSRLLGIITERDMTARVIAAGLNPEISTARDIMTADPDTLSPNDTAADAIRMMKLHNYRHLPVVNDDGVLLGILSIRNLLQAKIDDLTQQLDSIEVAMSNDAPGGD